MWKGLEGQVYSWQHRMLLQDHQFLGMVLLLLAVPKAARRNYQEEKRKENRCLTLTHSLLSNKKVPEPIRVSLVPLKKFQFSGQSHHGCQSGECLILPSFLNNIEIRCHFHLLSKNHFLSGNWEQSEKH